MDTARRVQLFDDRSSTLDDAWFKKPSVLFPWTLVLDGRAAYSAAGNRTVGFALDVEPNNAAAMGFWTGMLAPYGSEVLERLEPDGGRFLRHTFATDPLIRVSPGAER